LEVPPISLRCSARAWNIETIGTLLDAEASSGVGVIR